MHQRLHVGGTQRRLCGSRGLVRPRDSDHSAALLRRQHLRRDLHAHVDMPSKRLWLVDRGRRRLPRLQRRPTRFDVVHDRRWTLRDRDADLLGELHLGRLEPLCGEPQLLCTRHSDDPADLVWCQYLRCHHHRDFDL